MESKRTRLVRAARSTVDDSGGTHFRLLGVGVGPANLSLASLLHAHDDVPNIFLDRKDSFSWHDGQQISGATLQVSMLKDLVSLSDPTNEFSFLAYLHDQGKLYHFINAQFDAMPRLEFRNYLEWASRRNKNVVFGEGVHAIDFDGQRFVVHTDRRTLTADNVSVAIGSQPWIPLPGQDWETGSQFHVCEFVRKAVGLGGKRVVVVGGGQSGAEAFLDLISRPDGELPSRVEWISRRRNFLPIDDSPFTNDYFMPSHSEYFYGLDRLTRERINRENVLTSDGISFSTLREIYQKAYHHRFVAGEPGLIGLRPNRTVQRVDRQPGGWEVRLADNDRPDRGELLRADVIVWATGFRTAPMDFLAPLNGRLRRDGGEYRIDRDYAVCWDGPQGNNLFIQNAARAQRGLADPNLSLLAWRSQRIADRLRGVRGVDPLASFIEWSAEVPVDELRQGA